MSTDQVRRDVTPDELDVAFAGAAPGSNRFFCHPWFDRSENSFCRRLTNWKGIFQKCSNYSSSRRHSAATTFERDVAGNGASVRRIFNSRGGEAKRWLNRNSFRNTPGWLRLLRAVAEGKQNSFLGDRVEELVWTPKQKTTWMRKWIL